MVWLEMHDPEIKQLLLFVGGFLDFAKRVDKKIENCIHLGSDKSCTPLLVAICVTFGSPANFLSS
jgi:hypothetical protein